MVWAYWYTDDEPPPLLLPPLLLFPGSATAKALTRAKSQALRRNCIFSSRGGLRRDVRSGLVFRVDEALDLAAESNALRDERASPHYVPAAAMEIGIPSDIILNLRSLRPQGSGTVLVLVTVSTR